MLWPCPRLFAAARSGEKPVRLAAIRALAEIGDPSASRCLWICWTMPTSDIAQAAQESLAALPGKEVDAAIMTDAGRRLRARRITAMDLIVRRRMTSAIPALFNAAGGSDAKLRAAAVRSWVNWPAPPNCRPARPAGQGEQSGRSGGHGADPERGLSEGSGSCSCVGQLEARLGPIAARAEVRLVRVLGAIGGTKPCKPSGRRSVTPTPRSTPRRFAPWAVGAPPMPLPTCWSWPERRAARRTR